MFDQPRSADRQVFSNSRRRTSAEGTTEGDRHAHEHSDSTCEQLHVRHLKAEPAREGPTSSEYPDRPARSFSLERELSVRMRVGKSCAVHSPQHTSSLDRQSTWHHNAACLLLAALPRPGLEGSRPSTDEALGSTSRSPWPAGPSACRYPAPRVERTFPPRRNRTRDNRSKTSTKFLLNDPSLGEDHTEST
jgi:hypothetical protein